MQLSTYPTKKFTAENRVLLTADDTTSNCHFRWPVPPAYYTVRRSTDPSQSTFSGVMNSILITGCNRGLGLGLVKSLAKLPKPPQHIFATCRDAEQAVVSTNVQCPRQPAVPAAKAGNYEIKCAWRKVPVLMGAIIPCFPM